MLFDPQFPQTFYKPCSIYKISFPILWIRDLAQENHEKIIDD